jgi:2,5-dioxopentanoate dehydrogenase
LMDLNMIDGSILIGARDVQRDASFAATNPATGDALPQAFSEAGAQDVEEACASTRREPIPVYAEMSSINPVVLLPAALEARAEALGTAFIGSLTLGAGQFCTNPGLVIAVGGPGLDRFVKAAVEALAAVGPPVMLSPGIHANYAKGIASLDSNYAADRIATGKASDAANRCTGALFETSGAAFLKDTALGHEVFGASAIIVRCSTSDEVVHVVAGLEGQLTATVHMDDADAVLAASLLPLLQGKAGRVLANGWPTGVEVTHAMVHGGPYPATSDGRSTSVGTLSMMRFLRPVCYQDIPDALLPPALQAANTWKLPRKVDGKQEAMQ